MTRYRKQEFQLSSGAMTRKLSNTKEEQLYYAFPNTPTEVSEFAKFPLQSKTMGSIGQGDLLQEFYTDVNGVKAVFRSFPIVSSLAT